MLEYTSLTQARKHLSTLKTSNINTRKRCEICSKLTIKTSEQFPLHCVFLTMNR